MPKRNAPIIDDQEINDGHNDETAQSDKKTLRSGKVIEDDETLSRMKKKKPSVSLESTDESESDGTPVAMERVGMVVRAIVEEAGIGNVTEKTEGAAVNSPPGSEFPTVTEGKVNDPLGSVCPSINEATSGLVVIDERDVRSATNSPVREVYADGAEDFMNMTSSEFDELMNGCSSLEDDDEYPPKVAVGDYRLRPEYAETARKILDKYGDILAGTAFASKGMARRNFLENICAIYQKLEKATLGSLKVPELESMREVVQDCLKINVGISWLAKMLDEIYDCKMALQRIPYVMEECNLSRRIISELEKELELQRTIMRKVKDKIQEIEAKIEAEKAKSARCDQAPRDLLLKVQRFSKKLLVDR